MGASRRKRAHRAWRLGLFAAALVVLAPVTWIGAHHARTPPAPRWSEEDLPARVRAEENGVPLARALARVEIPEALAELARGHASPEDGWRASVEEQAQLVALVSPHRGALAAIDRRPRYRDDCAPRAETTRQVLPLLRAQELAALAVYQGVAVEAPYDDEPIAPSAQAWERADEAAARLVERHRDLHGGPRTLLGAAASVALLERAFGALAPLAHGARLAGVSLPRLGRAVEAPLSALDLRSPVIGEYLVVRDGIARVGGLFFDAARSAEEADERFARLLAYAEDPSTPRPALALHRERFAWFLYDPGGKALLDVLALDVPAVIDDTRARHEAAERARRELQEEIARARGGAGSL